MVLTGFRHSGCGSTCLQASPVRPALTAMYCCAQAVAGRRADSAAAQQRGSCAAGRGTVEGGGGPGSQQVRPACGAATAACHRARRGCVPVLSAYFGNLAPSIPGVWHSGVMCPADFKSSMFAWAGPNHPSIMRCAAPPCFAGCAAGLDVLDVMRGLDVFAACFAYSVATHSFVQRPAAAPSTAAFLSVSI